MVWMGECFNCCLVEACNDVLVWGGGGVHMLEERFIVGNDQGCNASIANKRTEAVCGVKNGAARVSKTVHNYNFVRCIYSKNGSACIVGE